MMNFKKVGITGKKHHPDFKVYLSQLISCLQKHNITAYIDTLLTDMLIADKHSDTIVSEFKEIEKECDLIIVIGGDGSFLSTARKLKTYKTPLAGLNLGNLGFLNEISPYQLDKQLSAMLAGNFIKDSRFFLETKIFRENNIFDKEIALNDVVIHPGEFARIIEYELYIDNQFVYRQRADGLIVATPTGSTAYALSAGGPVMSPKLDAIVLAPMHPHLLTNRPLVVHGDSEIKVIVTKETSNLPRISCDGQVHLKSHYQDEIIIYKKKEKLKIYHPPEHNFYKSCRSKLGWNASSRRNRS